MNKWRLTVLVLSIGLILLSCTVQKTEEQIEIEKLADEMLESGEQMYLAHNIWYQDFKNIKSINYKSLPKMLEVGEPVEDVVLANTGMDPAYQYIRFRMSGQFKHYHLYLNIEYQVNGDRSLTLKELAGRTFTTKPFDELVSGLSPEEIANIEHGTIQMGMSKRAVLMSWGYPPLHYNRSLDQPRWTYWKRRNQREHIHFDEHDRVREATWYGKDGNSTDVIE